MKAIENLRKFTCASKEVSGKILASNTCKMMPTMPPDSYTISLKIIEAIKQHPVLYSSEVKGSSIKLQEFKQKVWKRISDELGLDPSWVRLKWKNLKDTYCRILKCKSKTIESRRRKKWIFEDHLSFLRFPYEADYQPQCIELTEEYIQDINTSEISSEGLLQQLEDHNDEDYSEYLEVLEETAADPILLETLDSDSQYTTSNLLIEQETVQQNIDNYAQHIQSKYRKLRPKRLKTSDSPVSRASSSYSVLTSPSFKTNSVDLLDTNTIASPVLITNELTPNTSTIAVKGENNERDSNTNYEQIYLAPESKSSIELFFDSMAQTMKKLPPKAQADIKMNICKIVTEAEVQYSDQNSPQSIQHFIASSDTIPKLVLIPCKMIDNQDNED